LEQFGRNRHAGSLRGWRKSATVIRNFFGHRC
jgi:hypothetical protein